MRVNDININNDKISTVKWLTNENMTSKLEQERIVKFKNKKYKKFERET